MANLKAIRVNGNEISLNEKIVLTFEDANITLPSFNEMLDELKSTRGKNKGKFRSAKPQNANGLIKYLWRMIRFNAGLDLSMPITASWDLQDWLESEGYLNDYKTNENSFSVSGVYNKNGKDLTDILDNLADVMALQLNLNPLNAAIVWGRALGY